MYRSYIDKPVSLGRKFHLIIGEFVTRDHRFANCCLVVLFCSIRWRESKSGCGRDGEKAKASSSWWKVLSFFHLVVCLLKKQKLLLSSRKFCPIFIVCLFAEWANASSVWWKVLSSFHLFEAMWRSHFFTSLKLRFTLYFFAQQFDDTANYFCELQGSLIQNYFKIFLNHF